MAPTFPQLNPAKFQKYIFRLPLLTRTALLLIVAFWVLELQSAWDVATWGALIPREVNLKTSMCKPQDNLCWSLCHTDISLTVYRLNTYPLVHLGFIHTVFNIIALVPLLERFEAEHGTLLTAAFFAGRESL